MDDGKGNAEFLWAQILTSWRRTKWQKTTRERERNEDPRQPSKMGLRKRSHRDMNMPRVESRGFSCFSGQVRENRNEFYDLIDSWKYLTGRGFRSKKGSRLPDIESPRNVPSNMIQNTCPRQIFIRKIFLETKKMLNPSNILGILWHIELHITENQFHLRLEKCKGSFSSRT